jgi:hypothetical protein
MTSNDIEIVKKICLKYNYKFEDIPKWVLNHFSPKRIETILSIEKLKTDRFKYLFTSNIWNANPSDIEQILDDFGIEFYAVTGGANCYSGTKTNSFETEKYGILYTEFTYCKSNEVQRLRVYNKSSDQELRDPKPGEIYTYDKYGYRNSSSSTDKGL